MTLSHSKWLKLTVKPCWLIYLLLSLLLIARNAWAEQLSFSFCYEEWQPYAYLDEQGNKVGTSLAFIRKKLNAANVHYQFKQLPFPHCKQAVESGKVDFILHVDDTDSFELIPKALNSWQLTFAVSETSHYSFQQIMDSQGLRILMARSYSYPVAVLEQLETMAFKPIKVSYYSGEVPVMKRLFYRLTAQQADAMLVDKVWAQKMIAQHKLPINVFEQVVHEVPQYIGCNNKNSRKALQLQRLLFDE